MCVFFRTKRGGIKNGQKMAVRSEELAAQKH